MSEAIQAYEEQTSSAYEELLFEVEAQSCNPPGGDESIGRLWESLSRALADRPYVYEFVSDFAEQREGPVSEKAGTLRTVFTADTLATYDGIPASVDEWDEYFTELDYTFHLQRHSSHAASDERIAALYGNAMNLSRRVQTNIYTRYTNTIELLMQLYRDRFDMGVQWLDVGSGINEGPHALLCKEQLDLSPVQIRRRNGRTDKRLSRKASYLRAMPSVIRSVMGVDLFDPSEQLARDWVVASLRHTELDDPGFMRQFYDLAQAQPPEATTARLDITDTEAVDAFVETHPERYNFQTYITMQHQLKPHERETALHNMDKLGTDDRLVVIQDFAYTLGSRPQRPLYYKHWFKEPFRYRTLVYDTTVPDMGWQEVFRAKDSRCQELQLGVGRLALGGSLVSVEEALLAA